MKKMENHNRIIKYVLISQNTTVLAKILHRVSTVSTTCFGFYIGHRHVVDTVDNLCTIFANTVVF